MLILVGDIGGSNTRLALAERRIDGIGLTRVERFPNDKPLTDRVRDFIAGSPTPERACLAVAGPTDGASVTLTNLGWRLVSEELSAEFGFPVRLVNDFQAVAQGLDAMTGQHLICLQDATPVTGAPCLAIGPGTGLGVAIAPAGSPPLAGEGGHIGFAPADDEQVALLHFLRQRHGRVSVERILSGPGIVALHAYCRAASGRPVKTPRQPADITDAALAGNDPVAAWAMRLFCRILGQTAGDLALASGARGGVYLAGGIPPRILPLLRDGSFLEGLLDKGRFSGWTAQLPVYVITDPDIGLKGAALGA